MTVDEIGNAMATLERIFETVYWNIRAKPTVASTSETSLTSTMPSGFHQQPVEKDNVIEQLTEELAEMRLKLSRSHRSRGQG
jgi:hypothetical protein